jgi:DinB superfamily
LTINERPSDNEYGSFYSGYVSLVPETDIESVLRRQMDEIERVAGSVSEERERYRYAPGKWSIREVFGHLGDGERVFGYRAFCISRGDQAPLPGFDEKAYIAISGYDERPLAELATDLLATRQSNLRVLASLDEIAWGRSGNANGSPVSVRALGFIMAGHMRHHLGVLAERYGV